MKKSRFDRFVELLDAALKSHFEPGQPIDAPADHPVWKDFEKAVRAEFGGKAISIPGFSKPAAEKRDAKIVRDRSNGVPVAVLVEKYGLSRAAIYKILKKETIQPKK